MTAHAKPRPHLEQLIRTFASWLAHRRELNELHQIDRTELDCIAGDLQVSPSALEELVEKGPHSADELLSLLQALGIDQAVLARTQPTVLRDMERVCALCQHKRECDHDIAAGTATEHYKDYCPNASTIGQLDETAAGQ
jgi:hypothetical protein